MERDDARAGLAALFQEHKTDERHGFDGLLAIVGCELRRVALELDRGDRAAMQRRAPPVNMLSTRVAMDAAIPAEDHDAFNAVCARAMRRAVVEHMAGEGQRHQIAGAKLIVAIDAALNVVERVEPRLVRTVECRYFADLTEEESARAASRCRDAQARVGPCPRLDAAGAGRGRCVERPSGQRHVDRCGARRRAGAAARKSEFDSRALPPDTGRSARADRGAAVAFDRNEAALRARRLAAEFLFSILTIDDAPASDAAVDEKSWRIVREIRRGRLGPLWLAERTAGASTVRGALRFLPSCAGNDLAAFRLRQDWRAIASLKHRGIARALDSGELDGRLFVVSELVEGCPIDRYSDEERLTIDERLQLFLRVCEAVQHAHRKLVVHGGSSPSTVVIRDDGQVKLLDFGMAGVLAGRKPEEDESDPSAPGPFLAYASPEQLRGEPLAVASDVYQLGLLLYLLLTGEQARAAGAESGDPPLLPSARVAAARQQDANAATRQIPSGAFARKLRGDLDAIVMYALRKEPERRYPSVGLLRADIERYEKCFPLVAHEATRTYRFRKFVTRRRRAVARLVRLQDALLRTGSVG